MTTSASAGLRECGRRPNVAIPEYGWASNGLALTRLLQVGIAADFGFVLLRQHVSRLGVQLAGGDAGLRHLPEILPGLRLLEPRVRYHVADPAPRHDLGDVILPVGVDHHLG